MQDPICYSEVIRALHGRDGARSYPPETAQIPYLDLKKRIKSSTMFDLWLTQRFKREVSISGLVKPTVCFVMPDRLRVFDLSGGDPEQTVDPVILFDLLEYYAVAKKQTIFDLGYMSASTAYYISTVWHGPAPLDAKVLISGAQEEIDVVSLIILCKGREAKILHFSIAKKSGRWQMAEVDLKATNEEGLYPILGPRRSFLTRVQGQSSPIK